MRIIKSILPIIVLLIGSFYGFREYDQLPASVINGIAFLPHMLALMVIGLSIHFSRSSVFYYVVLVVIANVFLRSGWATGDISYGLLSTFLPLLLLVLTVIPDRGIISVRGLPAHAFLLLVIGFSIFAATRSIDWVAYILLTDWAPAQYFDWTRLSQSALIMSVIALNYMLVLCILQPSPHISAGFGVLIMLIAQMHFGDNSRSLDVFSSIALLMCLYAIMQESWRMAYLDELTGLPGRRALREKFQKIGGLYTVAMLDVDHFKKFNDTYGHDTGDAVLRMIASKMTRVSGGGVAYRYGGEEFSIIFTGKYVNDSRPYLDELRDTIAKSPFVINRISRRKDDEKTIPNKRKSVRVTVSIGVADSSIEVESPWDVLKLADKALYRAKKKGRNLVSI
jgi:diguanylate cyclase (GGDEF)-like protein